MAFLTDISHRLAESPVTKLLLLSALAVLPLRALIRRGTILVWLPGPPMGNWITGKHPYQVLPRTSETIIKYIKQATLQAS